MGPTVSSSAWCGPLQIACGASTLVRLHLVLVKGASLIKPPVVEHPQQQPLEPPSSSPWPKSPSRPHHASSSSYWQIAMAKAQFNVRLDPALAARLRREAQHRQQTPGVLVAEAIELLLSSNSPAPGPAPQGLAEALAALQQRVAKLERCAPAQAPPPPAQLPIELPAGAITTAELAERTGTNRAAWNNWANKAAPGQVRHHPEAGSWRLVGKGAGPNGGPERWLWEPA